MNASRHPPSPSHQIAEAALALVAQRGWAGFTLDDLAHKAKLTPTALRRACPTKADLIPLIVRYIDACLPEVLGKVDPALPLADRLFDVLMSRFELLQRHRAAILDIAESVRRSPDLALCMTRAQHESMRAMMPLINHAKKHPQPMVLGLFSFIAFHFAFLTWEKDDTDDLSKTMAALNSALHTALRLFPA